MWDREPLAKDPNRHPSATSRGEDGLASGPLRLAVAAAVALGVLAPLVPDEPFHLSGVIVVAGLVFAAAGLVWGLFQSWSSDPGIRRSARWAAALSALAIAGMLFTFYARAMSQLSS